MKNSIFKSIVGGIVVGTILFFTGPFLFLFIGAVLLLKFIFTPFGYGRMMMYNGHYGPHHMWRHGRPAFVYADKIRNMSEEDYQRFKDKMQSRQHCGYRYEKAEETGSREV